MGQVSKLFQKQILKELYWKSTVKHYKFMKKTYIYIYIYIYIYHNNIRIACSFENGKVC